MSLFALPVTSADLTQLQQGIEFFTNTAEANAEVTLINAGTDTVDAYAHRLLDANLALSQVAMAVNSLMYGATDTTAELTKLSTVFLPPQVSMRKRTASNRLSMPPRRLVWGWREAMERAPLSRPILAHCRFRSLPCRFRKLPA